MLPLRKCSDKAQTGKTYSCVIFTMECYQTYIDNAHKSKIKRQVVNGQNFKIIPSQEYRCGFLCVSPVSTLKMLKIIIREMCMKY